MTYAFPNKKWIFLTSQSLFLPWTTDKHTQMTTEKRKGMKDVGTSKVKSRFKEALTIQRRYNSIRKSRSQSHVLKLLQCLSSVDSVNSSCEQNSVQGLLHQRAVCAVEEIDGS